MLLIHWSSSSPLRLYFVPAPGTLVHDSVRKRFRGPQPSGKLSSHGVCLNNDVQFSNIDLIITTVAKLFSSAYHNRHMRSSRHAFDNGRLCPSLNRHTGPGMEVYLHIYTLQIFHYRPSCTSEGVILNIGPDTG